MEVVSIIKYDGTENSLRRALELCDGLKGLEAYHKVLIKPNIVYGDRHRRMPPFGVVSTTRLVEDMVKILKAHGVHDISIGEGTAIDKTVFGERPNRSGSDTDAGFEGLGYNQLRKRYNVRLIDFNRSEAVQVDLGQIAPSFAREALEADFFIDMAVMKAHAQTKVSLGLKNLKGCLKIKSRRMFHHPDLGLEYCISLIPEKIRPALTIIDGIYALERGPWWIGNAHRRNLIVASQDLFAADVVGASLMGFDPGEIRHLVHYARRFHRPLDYTSFEIEGEPIDELIEPIEWDMPWKKDNTGPRAFERMGIEGIAIRKYDDTLCTGCTPIINMSNVMVMSAFKGQRFPDIEVISGKKMQAREGYSKTILIGKCIIEANEGNPNINEAVEVKGCPPSIERLVDALKASGVACDEGAYDRYTEKQFHKYDGKPEFDWELFSARLI